MDSTQTFMCRKTHTKNFKHANKHIATAHKGHCMKTPGCVPKITHHTSKQRVEEKPVDSNKVQFQPLPVYLWLRVCGWHTDMLKYLLCVKQEFWSAMLLPSSDDWTLWAKEPLFACFMPCLSADVTDKASPGQSQGIFTSAPLPITHYVNLYQIKKGIFMTHEGAYFILGF